MKAENILNSNSTSKNTICYEKSAKNKFFKIFISFLMAIFLKIKCFKTFLIQPPISMTATCLKHEKRNLHES